MAMARPPAAVDLGGDPLDGVLVPVERATAAPSAASARAIAAPMPMPAPVTMPTLPAKR